MELVKTLRAQAALFGRSPFFRRTAKIGLGLLATVFFLQFYYIRELLFAELAFALLFLAVALIGAVYALACIAVLSLGRLRSGLKSLNIPVTLRHPQAFTTTTITGLSAAKEEVS